VRLQRFLNFYGENKMLKQLWKLFAALALSLYMAASMAAVDANKANAAELDAVKGIGPGTSARILEARKAGEFKNWQDLIDRVKGVGSANAKKFAANGMTVNGVGTEGIAEKAAPAKADKATKEKKVKADTATAPAAAPAPAADAKAAAPAADKAASSKESKKAEKDAAKAAKAEEKAKAKADKADAKNATKGATGN
jgi:competence protein ComEA